MRLLAVRPAQRCAICHDDLGPDDARSCTACATRGHEGCFAETGCPTLGCVGRGVVRLPVLVPMPPPVWPEVASDVLRAVLPAALACAAAFVGPGPAAAGFVCLLLCWRGLGRSYQR